MKTNAAATFLNVCLGTSALLVTAMLVRSEMAATRSLPVPQVRRLFLDSVPAGVDYFAGGHRIGPADKAPAMVVFSDYQCPACKLLHRELELRRNRSQHDLTIAYRHWPLSRHPHAERAAMASECAAPQGRFAQMHDSLFARSGNLEAVTSQQLALAAGVADIDRFLRCMSSDSIAAVVRKEAEVARAIGSDGTPTVVLRGGKAFFGVPAPHVLDSLISALSSSP
jgi:protein-disulfide isomerase